MLTDANMRKAKTVQFPTFRGGENSLIHIKAVADKKGVSYATIMNLIVSTGISKMQESEAFKLSDEEINAAYVSYL